MIDPDLNKKQNILARKAFDGDEQARLELVKSIKPLADSLIQSSKRQFKMLEADSLVEIVLDKSIEQFMFQKNEEEYQVGTFFSWNMRDALNLKSN